MAITLVTGVPGSGKTLWAVWSLLREIAAGRRVCANGIRGLAIDHVEWDDDTVRQWYSHCQANDVIVIDEAQRIWPSVSVSVKATEDIEKLHVHRHYGVDMVLITQHPNRVNKTIRDLVGRHVHVRRLFGMRRAMIYEWDCAHNPNSGFRDAVKSTWNYPRKVFDLYVSAELHTKPKAVIPKALFVLPVAIVAVVVLGWLGFKRVSAFGSPKSVAAVAGSGVGASASVAGGAAKPVDSSRWRVAGTYSVGGNGFVLLADAQGRLRREPSSEFKGEGLGAWGLVDGDRVSVWTAPDASVAAGVGGVK